MKLGKMIKRDAKAALRGSWGKAIAMLAAILGIGLCIDVIDAATFQLLGYDFQYVSMEVFRYSENFFYDIIALGVSFVFAIIRIILLIPLGLGMLNWYLELTDRKRGNVSSIFWAYESRAAIRSILLAFNVGIKMFLMALVAMILPVGITVAADFAVSHYALSTTLLVISLILTLVASLLLFAFSQRFALTQILLCDKYKLTTHQAVKQSVKYMKGHKWELVRFELSFLPWFLPLIFTSIAFSISWSLRTPFTSTHILWGVLTLIVYVLTMLFLTPYLTMSQTIYCRYLYEYGVWNENQRKAACEPTEAVQKQPDISAVSRPEEPKEEVKEATIETPTDEPIEATIDTQEPQPEQNDDLGVDSLELDVDTVLNPVQPNEQVEPLVTPNSVPEGSNDQASGHSTSEKI